MRLVLMARFGMDLPTELIEEQISTAINLIVVMRRLADGSRHVASLTEVSRGSRGEAVLDECVSFDRGARGWRLEREPRFIGEALADGLLEEGEVQRWRHQLS